MSHMQAHCSGSGSGSGSGAGFHFGRVTLIGLVRRQPDSLFETLGADQDRAKDGAGQWELAESQGCDG